MLGGVLDIKPIIEIDKDGALVATEKVRGRQKSLKRIVDIACEHGVELDKQIISVVHGNDQETCDKVAEMMMERAHCRGIIKSWVGCAIGAHTGPGIVAVVFSNASDEKYAQYLK